MPGAPQYIFVFSFTNSETGKGFSFLVMIWTTNIRLYISSVTLPLYPQVQKQSMLSHNAQDSHALWEEELKSRSKLGLRLAELEKEKGELSSQVTKTTTGTHTNAQLAINTSPVNIKSTALNQGTVLKQFPASLLVNVLCLLERHNTTVLIQQAI